MKRNKKIINFFIHNWQVICLFLVASLVWFLFIKQFNNSIETYNLYYATFGKTEKDFNNPFGAFKMNILIIIILLLPIIIYIISIKSSKQTIKNAWNKLMNIANYLFNCIFRRIEMFTAR